MPFQVIYSEFSRQPGVINSFSAGADQIVVCDPTVTLTAIVNGDLFGHTVLWEQISGTAITFTSPVNQLVVTYENGAGSPLVGSVFDDKVFRFTIDKGSVDPQNPEMFDEVDIFGAPTELTYSGMVSVSSGLDQSYLDTNVPRCSHTSIGLPAGQSGEAECGVATGTLFWEPPASDDQAVVGYQVEEYISGSGFSVVATLKPNVRRYDGLVAGRSYRVVTLLSNGGVDIGCSQWFGDNAVFGQERGFFGMGTQCTGGGGVISNYEVLVRTIITCDDDPQLLTPNQDAYAGMKAGNAGSTISNYAVLTRTVIGCIDPQITAANNEAFSGMSSFGGGTISNYHSLVLTGGQVGG